MRRRPRSAAHTPAIAVIIASAALYFGMTLVTGSTRHFSRAPVLELLSPD